MRRYKTTKVTPSAHLFVLLSLTRASSARAKNTKRPLTFVNDLCVLVGVAGFEPAAPCSQNRCANRTALYPEQFFSSAVRGGFEPPVPVSRYASLANWWFQPLTHLTNSCVPAEALAKAGLSFNPQSEVNFRSKTATSDHQYPNRARKDNYPRT